MVASIVAALPADLVGDDPPAEDAPRTTVVWLSIDGVRPDYRDRAETPVLDRLIAEGAISRELVPVFPSLTFPGHVSQATGVKAAEHGVPGNSFIDRTTWRVHRYPWDSRLMQAEPIWITASRQGIRTAVYDWPLAHAQRGEVTAAHFGQRFIRGMSDEERIQMLLETWQRDDHPRPLQLLMGYVIGPDSIGHQTGPDADEPPAKLAEVDALLEDFIERSVELWQRTSRPGDALYVLLTTDHGMSPVHTLVHPERLADIEGNEHIAHVTSGNVGHYFVRTDEEANGAEEGDDEATREQHIAAILASAGEHDFARAYRRADLPEKWEYAHPTRVGDVVVVLETGYTFSRRPAGVTGASEDFGGPLGMHGYDPRTDENMNGLMVLWRHPEPLGGIDLGPVHSLQLHATVAGLLGIDPAEGARRDHVQIGEAEGREDGAGGSG